MRLKHLVLLVAVIFLFKTAQAQTPTFKHRGFYLHEGWYFKHPFAVKTWSRNDYSKMFLLLEKMGYDQVLLWPMLEAVPSPLSGADEQALRDFRSTVEDAKSAGLECWIVQNANLTPSGAALAELPWKQRVPYDAWTQVRLDDPAKTAEYLAHRSAMMAILNNADAYLTIDGDPGGYPGARPEDWLEVFKSDRQALDKHGTHPAQQRLLPWIWSGWGAGAVWGGSAWNPPAQVKPLTAASMAYLKNALPEPWEILVGRSHREDWANGRVNVEAADSLGLMQKSTIFCYEAIEFEPTPPASILQFGHIRRILRQESQYSAIAEGVFGNAQQPIMVLPNIWFFAKCAQDISYADQPDEAVLREFAAFLGGPPELLVPAWASLQKGLASLPEDLPARLRSAQLNGQAAMLLPGGSRAYLDLLAKETECRIALLKATAKTPSSHRQAAEQLAKGLEAMVEWWEVHRYVASGKPGEPFNLAYVHGSQVALLQDWCRRHVSEPAKVLPAALEILMKNETLPKAAAEAALKTLLATPGKPQALHVSANGHYLQTSDGQPFFYLGDTAWELVHRLDRAEIELYLETRKQQGFNVVQAVALAEFDGARQPNAYGDHPLIGGDPTQLATTPGTDPVDSVQYDYWDHVEYTIELAAEKGLYVTLLPTWGDKVAKFWGEGPVIFNEENARIYGESIGQRFGNRANIIWMLGGDRPAVGEENGQPFDHRPTWRAMAEGIRRHSTVPQLMTYHTWGGEFTTSRFLENENWLDLHSMQSGHEARSMKVWEWIAHDWAMRPAKPSFDSEPCYEGIGVKFWDKNWTKATHGYFSDLDVRNQLYRSVFAGGFGVTYGHHCVWQFCDGKHPLLGFPEPAAAIPWQQALGRPVANQVRHLKELMLSVPLPYFDRIPGDDILLENPDQPTRHIAATRGNDGSWAMIYTPISQPIHVDLSKLSGNITRFRWFDPRTGRSGKAREISHKPVQKFATPKNGQDWVLLLE